jgi:putative ABC transport system permease protein
LDAGRDLAEREAGVRASRLGNPRDLLGHRINVNKKTATIVGVVRDIAFGGPEDAGSDTTGHPLAFLSTSKDPPDFMTLIAKVHGDASRYLAPARDAVQAADPNVAVFNARLFSQYLEDTLARPRLYTTAILFLGAFAILLAVIGIYGVASYSVGQRTHELGVRMAIGASPAGLRWMILRQSLRPVVIGVIVGLIGSAWLGQLLRTFNDKAEPVSGAISIAAGIALAVTAAIAAWSATRRIVRVDPLRALRSE